MTIKFLSTIWVFYVSLYKQVLIFQLWHRLQILEKSCLFLYNGSVIFPSILHEAWYLASQFHFSPRCPHFDFNLKYFFVSSGSPHIFNLSFRACFSAERLRRGEKFYVSKIQNSMTADEIPGCFSLAIIWFILLKLSQL